MDSVLFALSGRRPSVSAALRSSSRVLYDTVKRRSSVVPGWEPQRWTSEGRATLVRCSQEGVWIIVPGPTQKVEPPDLEAYISSLNEGRMLMFDALTLYIANTCTSLCNFATKRLVVNINGEGALSCFMAKAENIESRDTSMTIRHISVWDSSVPMPQVPSLTSLTIFLCLHVNDDFIRHFLTHTTLLSLTIDAVYGITDESLRHIGAHQRLHTLTLNNLHKITDDGIRSLSTLRTLKNVSVRRAPLVTVDGFRGFGDLSLLQSLGVERSLNGVRQFLPGVVQLNLFDN